MLKSVYGDNGITPKTAYYWYERFKSGNDSGEEELRVFFDLKTVDNVKKVAKTIRSNRLTTLKEHTETFTK